MAVSSSFYLQYVLGYNPCIYCYILRYLSISILGLSILGLLLSKYSSEVFSATAAFGLVGTAISAVLLYELLNPATATCTICLAAPTIFGWSLFYYSLTFMVLVSVLAVLAAFRFRVPAEEPDLE